LRRINEVCLLISMKTYGVPVNGLTIKNYTGVEKYALALVREMMKQPLYRDEKVVLYSSQKIEALEPLPYGWEWKIIKWSPKGWTHLRLSFEMLINPSDVLFIPAHEIPLLHRHTKIVNTIHDVAFKMFSDSYSLLQNLRQRWSIRRSIKANSVIAISEATKKDIKRYYKVKDSKVCVIHHAINPNDFETEDFDVFRILSEFSLKKDNYFLTVGRIEEKKNISMLIDAFEKYKDAGGVCQLVLVGNYGFGEDELRAKINNSRFRESIITPGYVADEHLPALFAGASAYAFPSKYEGFGLPLLEAMAASIPILASDIPALREVAKDAALFAGAFDIDTWAINMEKITKDEGLQRELVNNGKERLKDFSWGKTAKQTWKTLRSV